MKRFPTLLAALFLMLSFATAQQKEEPTITDKDIVILSPAQIEVLQAYQAYQPLRDKAYADAKAEIDGRLAATKEFQRLQAANAALTLAVNDVYAAHKLKPTEQQICFGPAAEGPCKDAPEKKYVWRAVPKAKTETAAVPRTPPGATVAK